jgi:hypothetical protein
MCFRGTQQCSRLAVVKKLIRGIGADPSMKLLGEVILIDMSSWSDERRLGDLVVLVEKEIWSSRVNGALGSRSLQKRPVQNSMHFRSHKKFTIPPQIHIPISKRIRLLASKKENGISEFVLAIMRVSRVELGQFDHCRSNQSERLRLEYCESHDARRPNIERQTQSATLFRSRLSFVGLCQRSEIMTR